MKQNQDKRPAGDGSLFLDKSTVYCFGAARKRCSPVSSGPVVEQCCDRAFAAPRSAAVLVLDGTLNKSNIDL
jgi:hypothetical protein